MDLEDLHWYTQRKHLLILISGGVIWNNLMQAKEKRECVTYLFIWHYWAKCLIRRYHAVGDDGARWGRQTGEKAHGVTAVHNQSLFLCHLAQVMHHEAELHPHKCKT